MCDGVNPNLAHLHDQYIDAYADGCPAPRVDHEEPPWVDDDEHPAVNSLDEHDTHSTE